MNQWISEAHAFYDLNAWDKCADPTLKLEDMKGKVVRLGLDLASHIDITSIGYVFKDGNNYTIFDKSFLPEETIKEKNNPFYDNCIEDGSLIKAPGAAINYENIQAHILQAGKDFRVQECMYDAWNATETAQKMSDKVEMVKVAMNTANLSEPMKKFDAAIREGRVRHNGSKLLRWCLGNVVAKEDHNGNVFPRKSHEKLKIDPIVAILLAFAGWIAAGDETSVYEERGIRSL
jgi:phage terminase large subunit-like protein